MRRCATAGLPGLVIAGLVAVLLAGVALAAAPAPDTYMSGTGQDYENTGGSWNPRATGRFMFGTSRDSARMLAFRGTYSYYCGKGHATVTAGYLNVTSAGRFDYRFPYHERYGTAYVEISGRFLGSGGRAELSYLVDFVANGKKVANPYDTAHPKSLGCASWVKGTAVRTSVHVANAACTGQAIRPSRITIACGTGQFYAAGLKYTSYGGPTALARGTLYLDDCVPDCARGTFTPYPGQVRLQQVGLCHDQLYYEQVSWRYQTPSGLRTGRQNIRPQGCPAAS